MSNKKPTSNIIKVSVAIASAVLLYFEALIISFFVSVSSPDDKVIYSYLIAIAAILGEIFIICYLWGFIKNKKVKTALCCAFAVCIAAFLLTGVNRHYIGNIQTVGESDNLLMYYAPYGKDTKAVSLNEESTLSFTEDFPVIDGATALYPIYASFAKAVYPEEKLYGHAYSNKYLMCNTTTGAYENIVTGDADIIFAALPSKEQEKFAEENGVELLYTPIGKEAFVFFVNAKNPIENITVKEIQDIYSGKISEWSELGVRGFGKIRAFQRAAGSGSQSTLEKLMAGKTIIDAPKEDIINLMDGIIEKTADYKNYKNAIGYSFRFYSTEMVKNNQIKLLSIDKVYPSLENIENGTYPLASYFYAVTRSDADENTLKLLEWIQSKQGQKIVELAGYTPLGD